MSCVVRWWDVLFVKGMHFSSKNARLLNCNSHLVTYTKGTVMAEGEVGICITSNLLRLVQTK